MKMKPLLLNGTLLASSVLLSLLLGEVAARLVLNPADYLSISTVSDDILAHRVLPGEGGFDSWGFRNPGVPSVADIVVLGDSHTYGNNAKMSESWPYVAQELTGKSVYNLGLGGYGPNQYYHLLETRAIKLRPSMILCGLYLGDDFENAFLVTYGYDHWSWLRKEGWSGTDGATFVETGPPRRFGNLRNWLSHNSVIYRLAVFGPLLGDLKGALQIRAATREDDRLATLVLPELDIQEAFLPIEIGRRLDQSSGIVREGMRITFELLERMNDTARQDGAEFVIVLIPTKESVFADQLLGDPDIQLRDVIAKLVADEEMVRQELAAFFSEHDIRYVDTLEALRARIEDQLYIRSDKDMHPARNGYHVIGEAVADFLTREQGH